MGVIRNITRLFSFFRGSQVGSDSAGNRYFIERRPGGPGVRPRRWVVYAAPAQASSVPAGWYAWLHFPAGGPPRDGPQGRP